MRPLVTELLVVVGDDRVDAISQGESAIDASTLLSFTDATKPDDRPDSVSGDINSELPDNILKMYIGLHQIHTAFSLPLAVWFGIIVSQWTNCYKMYCIYIH
jgi:hypothetical protein